MNPTFDFVQVFHYRSYVSAQRRSDLGVVTLPASSLQIHALRARDSLDSIPGKKRLTLIIYYSVVCLFVCLFVCLLVY